LETILQKEYSMKKLVFRLGVHTLLLTLTGISAPAEQDFSNEILVYVVSGLDRVEGTLEVEVTSPSLAKEFLQFGIDGSSISPAVPDFRNSDTLVTAPDGRSIKVANIGRIFRIRTMSRENRDRLISILSKMPEVLFAEPNGTVYPSVEPNDHNFFAQGYLQGPQPGQIHAVDAWDTYVGNPSHVIAIVDWGIDNTHPDLLGKVSGDLGVGFGIGQHGTEVAGCAAANTNNTEGIAGVDWNAQLHSQRVDGASYAEVYQAVVDAVNYSPNVHVLNNSFETSTYSTIMRLAYVYAYKLNRVSVAAMGNDDESETQYPAGFGQGIIAVGSTNGSDVRLAFSNTGSHIDVTAPGITILTTTRDGNWSDPNYGYVQGTSISAPQVSGIASLLKGYRPSLSNDDIEQIIHLAVDKPYGMNGDPWTPEYGFGRANAHKAFNLLKIPYALNQWSATGGTVYASEPWLGYFYGLPGAVDGQYVGTRYEIRTTVTFPTAYPSVPSAWGRGVATMGYDWSPGNVCYTMGYCEIVPGTLTSTGATLRTWVYEITRVGGGYYGWYPATPGNAVFAYSVVGPLSIGSPTSLSATPWGSNSIRLEWEDNSNNEMGFKIERSTDGNNFSEVGELITNGNGTGTRTFDDEDSGLQQNVTYYYRVRGYAQEFTSGYSNTVAAVIPILGAPANLATTDHPYHVYLTWNNVSGAQAYRVYRDDDIQDGFIVVADVTGTSHLDVVPSSPTTYSYYIRAHINDYEGPSSSTVVAHPFHLKSTSSGVAATSGQRKVIRDSDGNYHLAFESGGGLWYSKSTNSGSSWSAEDGLLLTTDDVIIRSPSITVIDNSSGADHVLMVFDAHTPPDGYSMVARVTDASSGSVLWDEPIGQGSGWSGSNQTNPVVGYAKGLHQDPYALCLWTDASSGKLRMSARDPNNSDPDTRWSAMEEISSVATLDPSIAPFSGTSDQWSFAWVQSDNLYYNQMYAEADPTFNSGASYLVADGSYEEIEVAKPSVARLQDGKVGVCWEEYNSELLRRFIKYKERASNGAWSSTKSWGGSQTSTYYYTPSLSANTSTTDVLLAWRYGTSQLRYVKRASGVWGSVTDLATGYDPTLSVGHTNPSSELVLWRSGSSSPFTIGKQIIDYIPQRIQGIAGNTLSPVSAEAGRGGKIIFENGMINLAVLRATINDVPLSFLPLNDTLRIRTRQELESFLVTDPFVGTGTLSLELLYTASGDIPDGVTFHGLIRDASTQQTLSVARSFLGLRDTIVTLSIPLSYRDRSVTLALRAVGAVGAQSFEAEEWFLVDEPDSMAMLKPEVVENLKGKEIPTRWYLHQNYPNPFNPQTTIKYELPEDAVVNLKVYDLLGREVLTMVDGIEPAGYYEVSLDGSNLATGVYLYRLNAGNFSDIKKMLVIK
jgi:hypothetical protein